ncbi:hypothetical protein ENUP19_0297G0007 [Entamoeba nuttalli]|uniref:Uncharacterized protein n=2 Tax=Entamoeba nuttalli TaxID=412467 RepID=K2GEJ5_ENTNP|nr:hypothetical protein ENU1_069910 [Entamoeba nuttalli P19]EKE41041.1 hypothetical protein ENU1_069910 [Entamoeba nuttalli P19]|eukprot:XP_008856623.1 hypothetical protein ENU1_069910 [Entamoeba nuttalli P19]
MASRRSDWLNPIYTSDYTYQATIKQDPTNYTRFHRIIYYMIRKRGLDEMRESIKYIYELILSPPLSDRFTTFMELVDFSQGDPTKVLAPYEENEINRYKEQKSKLEYEKQLLLDDRKQNLKIIHNNKEEIDSLNKLIKQQNATIIDLKKQLKEQETKTSELKLQVEKVAGKSGIEQEEQIKMLSKQLKEVREMSLDYYNDVVGFRRSLRKKEEEFNTLKEEKEVLLAQLTKLKEVREQEHRELEQYQIDREKEIKEKERKSIEKVKGEIENEAKQIKMERSRIKSECGIRHNDNKPVSRYSVPSNEESVLSKVIPLDQMRVEISQFKGNIDEKTKSNQKIFSDCIDLENEIREKNGIKKGSITAKEEILEKHYSEMENQIKDYAAQGLLDGIKKEEEIMSKNIHDLTGEEVDQCLVYCVQQFLKVSSQEVRLLDHLNLLKKVMDGVSQSTIYEESISLTESIFDLEQTLLKVKEQQPEPIPVLEWGN